MLVTIHARVMDMLSRFISCPSNFGCYCWGGDKYPPSTQLLTVDEGLHRVAPGAGGALESSQPQAGDC